MALLEHGALSLGRIANVRLRLHWTAPLGAFVFTGFRFEPLAWLCFFGLVVAHELGHALVVKAAHARPTLIELTGFGGLCHWRGEVSQVARSSIAWGGIWAQLLLLGLAEAYGRLAPPETYEGWRVLSALTTSNAWLIAFNLIPIPPLDGVEAWKLPILLGRHLRGGELKVRLPAAAATQFDPSEEAFEAGHRSDEVRDLVAQMFDDAGKDPPE